MTLKLIVLSLSAILWQSGLVEGRDNDIDKHMPLSIEFCNEVKQIRSTYSSPEGISFVYKNPEKEKMTEVSLRYDFMADQFLFQHSFEKDAFYSTGTYIGPLSMFLLIGISRLQIAGHFENRNEDFDIRYAVYWSDYLEVYYKHDYTYYYYNKCYLEACVEQDESFFRVYKLGFCRDTYAFSFFPLNSPCIRYNNTENHTHIEPYLVNFTIIDDDGNDIISPFNNRTEYEGDIDSECSYNYRKNIYEVKPNFCGSEQQKKRSHAVLNTLFPYEFSFQSHGGLFRSLVFFQGRLYWLENTPVLKYRYLEELTDPHGNYSDKWIEGKVDGSKGIADSFYFAGAFVFPQYGNYLDEVYFLLLPKNFTFETVPIYRKVATMLPLKFTKENYTLDVIMGKNCSKWLEYLLPAKTSEHMIFAITLVVFLIFFLLLVTLFTSDFCGKHLSAAAASTTTLADHSQSVLLDDLLKK